MTDKRGDRFEILLVYATGEWTIVHYDTWKDADDWFDCLTALERVYVCMMDAWNDGEVLQEYVG
jgi:hypothetical protein